MRCGASIGGTLLALSLALALAGCGRGGHHAPASEPDGGAATGPGPGGTLAGRVVDGPVAGALVTCVPVDADGAVRAPILDQVVTGGEGAFSVPSDVDVTGPILCATTGGTDGNGPAPPLALVLPVDLTAGTTVLAQINPFTTIAYRRLRALGDFSPARVAAVSAVLAHSLGLSGPLWEAAYGGTTADDAALTALLDAFDAAVAAVAGPGGDLLAAADALLGAVDRDTADGALDGRAAGTDVLVDGTPLADLAPDLVGATPTDPPPPPPPADGAPTADAGPDRTVDAGTPVTLDGSASSDPEGDALTYRWALTTAPAGSVAALSSTSVARPGFTPAVAGVYVFTLTVDDGTLVSVPDTVQLTAVAPGNAPPVARAGADSLTEAGTAVTLDGGASSDPDGDALTYLWQVTDRPVGSTALPDPADALAPSFTPDVAGVYVLSLTVNDGSLASAPDPVQVTATAPVDLAPVADAGPDQGVSVWTPVTLDGTASRDPEGAALTFLWTLTAVPAGSTAALSGATVPAPGLTPDVAGTYEVSLTVNDGAQDSAPDTVRVTASDPVPNPARYVFDGLAADDWLGYAVAGPGDVDGDGHADLAAAAFRAGGGAGQVLVYDGADGTVRYALSGQTAGDYLGRALAAAGDVDADGLPDLVVGIPGATAGGTGAGRVRVLRGSDGLSLHIFDGAAGEGLGTTVAGAGDVNGDGYADVVAGAPAANANQGLARVYSGFNGAVLHTVSGQAAGDRLGAGVAGVGDVDGDGDADVAIGAPGDSGAGAGAGAVLVISGADGSVLRRLEGPETYAAFGQAVAGAGDVDGDGRPDIAVGTPNYSAVAANAGRVDVFSGADGTVLATWTGAAAQDQFGFAIAGTGDVNGDGVPDVAVGVIGSDAGGTSAGRMQVMSGADGSVLKALDGGAAYDGLGRSVAGAGDVDGDGYGDAIVGAPGADAAGTDAGQARVVLGGP